MDILIIDDEITARKYLHSTLSAAGYSNIREADNGSLAFHMIQEKEPDIIIADIRMPEVDGIELLKILRNNDYKTIYILLSGYEIFSSAQEALRHNAFAYLLKPVSDEELLQTIKRAERELEAYRIQENKGMTNERNQFISNIIFQRQTDTSYIHKNAPVLLSQLHHHHYAVALFRIYPLPNSRLSSLLDEVNALAQSVFKEKNINSYSFIEEQSLIFLLNLPAILVTGKNQLPELLYNIQQLSNAQIHPNVYAAAGYVTSDLSELHSSYQFAYRMLKQMIEAENGRTAKYHDSWSLVPEQQEILYSKLNSRDIYEIKKQLYDIYAPFLDDNHTSSSHVEQLKNITLQILLLFTSFLTNHLIDSNLLGEEFSLYQELSALTNANDILNWVLLKAEQTLNLVNGNASGKEYDAINSARQYILEHLSESLTLESVAGFVHLSPNYFSRLFKDQTGISFIQYVTNTRINEAKRLLTDPHNKAKDVGIRVGYHDTKHFYKTFKAITGTTPGSYYKHFRENL